MSETTLNSGDLLIWRDPEAEDYEPTTPMLVEGENLMFQFSRRPWHQVTQGGVTGLTTAQAEAVLKGEATWTGPGYLFKAYDAELDQTYPDPRIFDGLD